MNKATFCYDDKEYLHNDAMYMIAGADKYIVAVLNSSVGWWSLKKSCTDLQNGYVQAYRENLFQIPICPATDAQKAPIIERVQKILGARGLETEPVSGAGMNEGQLESVQHLAWRRVAG